VVGVQTNDQRLSDAKEYLQSLSNLERSPVTGVHNVTDTKHYDLVAVVITMNRDRTLTDEDRRRTFNLGYLTQTVARLLQILHVDATAEFQRKKLIVCNVDTQPQTFTEALHLSNHVQIVSRYQNNSMEFHNGIKGDMFEKEKDDYVYCLQAASRFASPYYLIVEDDVMLDESAIETVSFIMNYFNLFSTTDWLFLKLYYPDKWLGYSQSRETVFEIGGYSVLGGSFFAVVIQLTSRHRKWLPNCRNLPVWFWFVVGAVFTALLCASIGRQYVELWRQYIVSTHRLVAAPGCCTQAIVYPAHVLPDLSVHLNHVHCDYDFSVDVAIDGFANIRGLKRHLIQPNVGKHIGLISNLRRNSKSAQHFL